MTDPPEAILTDTFNLLDFEIRSKGITSGTTAIACLIVNNHISFAFAGDSRGLYVENSNVISLYPIIQLELIT